MSSAEKTSLLQAVLNTQVVKFIFIFMRKNILILAVINNGSLSIILFCVCLFIFMLLRIVKQVFLNKIPVSLALKPFEIFTVSRSAPIFHLNWNSNKTRTNCP